MDVELGQAGLLLIGDVLRPDAGVAEEEALRGGETVNRGGLYAVQGVVQGRPGHAHSAVVGDVLAEGQGAVGHQAGHNLHLVELVHQHLGLLHEGGAVLGGPPVVHIAVLVEQAALVVKAVGHLVTDHHADGAVVHGVVRIRVEERRLEDTGREADLVGRRVIVGVDRLRGHAPLGRVRRLAELGQVVRHVPGAGGAQVLVVAQGRIDGEGAVVLPLVRVADLHGEGGELLAGLGLGGVGHPVQGVDVLAEGDLQILHQVEHLLLGALREELGNVHLADGLAEDAVGHAHGALPARFLLGDAAHLGAEEVEAGGVEVVGQGARGAAEQLTGEVVLEDFDLGVLEELAEALEVGRLLHDDLVQVGGDVHGLAEGLEVEARVGLEDLGGAHRVVELLDVAVLDAGPGELRQLVLDARGVGGALLGVVQAREGEELGEHRLIALAQLGVGRVHVVVAVAHAQAALAQVEDLGLAVHQVGVHAAPEEAALADEVQLAEVRGERLLVRDGVQLVEVLLDRGGTLRVQAGGIKPLLVQVDDFLIHGARLRVHVRHLGEQGVQVLDVLLAEHVEGAETGVFGFQGVLCHPAAVGVLEEIRTGGHGQVHVGRIQGRGFRFLGLASRQHHHRNHNCQ